MVRLEAGVNQLLTWRHSSDLEQEFFSPPPGMTVPVTSHCDLAAVGNSNLEILRLREGLFLQLSF
jgi:hypothetical protein